MATQRILEEIGSITRSSAARMSTLRRSSGCPQSQVLSSPRKPGVKQDVSRSAFQRNHTPRYGPSAKSANDWVNGELIAFNISFQNVDVPTFFGVPQLPPTTVSPVILNNIDMPLPPTILTKEERLFFEYLESANIYDKSAVDDFTGHLLRMLNFDDNGRTIVARKKLPFIMCGRCVWATPDFMVLDDGEPSLVVQEFSRAPTLEEPEAQLMAGVIAAFVERNEFCVPRLPQQTIPAIIMVGTRPVFYKVPVTQALVDALVTGRHPAEPTVVQQLCPPVPNTSQYLWGGMKPLETRTIVFQCLEAMRGMSVG